MYHISERKFYMKSHFASRDYQYFLVICIWLPNPRLLAVLRLFFNKQDGLTVKVTGFYFDSYLKTKQQQLCAVFKASHVYRLV